MRMKKQVALLLATSMLIGATSLAVSAASAGSVSVFDTGDYKLYDIDNEPLTDNNGITYVIENVGRDGSILLDNIAPNQTFYIPLGIDLVSDIQTELNNGGTATASQLVDDGLFKMSVDKSGNGKSLIKSITQISEKNVGDGRGSYLRVELNNSTTTEELKAQADITFKAKKTVNASTNSKDYDGVNSWTSGEKAELRLTMWINNKGISGTDGDAELGEGIYFDPESNDTNTLIWGDDRAALAFESDDDAGKFYAKLSTKSHSEIYELYADPVDADLWFYDFVGNPTIPSTSRATLTLGIPWDDDDDYAPDPTACYIYRLESDGSITDVTDLFTYSDDNDATGIEGWSIKTRTLGTYMVSDTELELDDYADDEEESSSNETEADNTDTSKKNPGTGR